MRKLYIIGENKKITATHKVAALEAGATEISIGIPPNLIGKVLPKDLPYIYEENASAETEKSSITLDTLSSEISSMKDEILLLQKEIATLKG